MHNTSSPAASLRLAWVSPTAVGMDALLSAKLARTSITSPPAMRNGRFDSRVRHGYQVYDKPDRGRRRWRRLCHLTKPTGSVKPDSAAVGRADRQVCAARPHVPDRGQPSVHQSPSDAEAAQVRQEVDVQMGG